MQYLAAAFDYDGTLANDGTVSSAIMILRGWLSVCRHRPVR